MTDGLEQKRTCRSLEQEIALCRKCKDRTGGDPFFFPLRESKVMVISAGPSWQAAYRPLTSIRFFRQLVYALLGYEGVSEEGMLRFFTTGDMYWTHYHKCYYEGFYSIGPDGLYEMQKLPESCEGRYLNEEIRQIRPRLILVLGKANIDHMFRHTLKPGEVYSTERINTTCLCVDYPAASTAEAYETVRKEVASALGIQPPADPIDMEQFVNKTVGSAVSLAFEEQAAQKLTDKLAGASQDRPDALSLLDNAWLDVVVVPLMIRQSLLLRYWSLMESQIKSFLMNEFSPTRAGHETFGSMLMDSGKGWTADDIIRKLSDNWLWGMKEYARFNVNRNQTSRIRSQQAYINEWEKLSGKLLAIKPVRNIIVHSDGFVSRSELYRARNYLQYSNAEKRRDTINDRLRDAGITGVEVLTNMVYVAGTGVEEMEALARQVAAFIRNLERALVGMK